MRWLAGALDGWPSQVVVAVVVVVVVVWVARLIGDELTADELEQGEGGASCLRCSSFTWWCWFPVSELAEDEYED